ncbi:MAG: hypothetical protein KC609_17540, partial [Myxococcales bacterium]|nr:hypothetical protein [Myxococcales bacterium]
MERADTTTLDWVETGDGSFTARSGECGELYHSSAGAWSECHEVYVRPFLDEIGARSPVPTRWVVLEIGLGIGLNWLALASAAARRGASLEIVSLEKDARVLAEPLPPRVIAALRRTTAPLGSENPTDEAPPLAEGLVESLETLKRDRSL